MTSFRVVVGIAVGVALAAFALGSARLGAVFDAPPASEGGDSAAPAPAPPPAAGPFAAPVAPAGPVGSLPIPVPVPAAGPLPAPVAPAGPVGSLLPIPALGPVAGPLPAPVPAADPSLARPSDRLRPPLASPAPARSQRARVAAGVLARAASQRAQEREAACPAPPRAEPGVESIEIDWNAPPQDP